MSGETKVKTERGPNWDREEKIIILNCFNKYKAVIENSKKVNSINQRRNEA